MKKLKREIMGYKMMEMKNMNNKKKKTGKGINARMKRQNEKIK